MTIYKRCGNIALEFTQTEELKMVKAKKKPLQIYLVDELKNFVEQQAIIQVVNMSVYVTELIKADKKRVERKAK